MERRIVTDEVLEQVLKILIQRIGERIEKHGRGAFASGHEGLGVLEEERWELVEALKANDPNRIAEEWIDCATTCVLAVASMVKETPATVETPSCDGNCSKSCQTECKDDCDGTCCEDDTPLTTTTQIDAAEVARQQMAEAAARAGIIIVDKI
jgi:hypothetical protein